MARLESTDGVATDTPFSLLPCPLPLLISCFPLGEPFETFWDDDQQQFMYSGAVKVVVGEGRLIRVEPGEQEPPGESPSHAS